MADENKDQESRIKIDDLPEAEKELSAEEAKNVKGGFSFDKIQFVKAGDGSVKPLDAENFAGDGLGSAHSKPQ